MGRPPSDWPEWPDWRLPASLNARTKIHAEFTRRAEACRARSNLLGYDIWLKAADEVERIFTEVEAASIIDFDPTKPLPL